MERLRASRSSAEPSRTWALTSAMCTHTLAAPSGSDSAEIASSKSRAVTGSIVNVGSDAQIAARLAGARDALDRLAGLALELRAEAATQAAIEHQALEHVARDARAPEDPQHAGRGARTERDEHEVAGSGAAGVGRAHGYPRARGAQRPPAILARREQRLGRQEAPATLEHRHDRSAGGGAALAPVRRLAALALGAAHPTFAASVLSATCRPAGVSTPLGTCTSGVIPAPCLTPPPPRLRPLGVKYSPTVMSSAPPLDSGSSSWKTPLPNVCVPTTVARR